MKTAGQHHERKHKTLRTLPEMQQIDHDPPRVCEPCQHRLAQGRISLLSPRRFIVNGICLYGIFVIMHFFKFDF